MNKAIRVGNELFFDDPIDFPCSYAWRSYYRETMYGEYMPRLESESKEPSEPPEVIDYRVIKIHDKQLTRKVNDLEGAVKYLLAEKQKKHRGKTW